MNAPPTKQERLTPWWLVMAIFVLLPVVVAFLISRQAAAQQIRRKAIASSHGWAIENRNEGQRAWVLHGFHRDVEFEAVQLLREGGGTAWRLRMPLGRVAPSWVLVSRTPTWRAQDFGTISTLLTRSELPPPATGGPTGYSVWGAPEVQATFLSPPVVALLTAATFEGQWAVSFADDGVVVDGLGAMPEGEALLPWLDLAAALVRVFSPDAG
ncbi:MAG: hypothetical protein JNJ54_13290 [Myxococcaceae bacterium]|nr:hypothetical protein [Myxococcaceae bacterium]